jgi:hypothetical protein
MGQRFAGIATVKADGKSFPLHGNFTVSPSPTERTGVAGQDNVHGYMEMPRVPFIEGEISMIPDMTLHMLDNITDATVIAELANGKVYVLRNAWTKSAQEINTHDGTTRVRWEGLTCDELA